MRFVALVLLAALCGTLGSCWEEETTGGGNPAVSPEGIKAAFQILQAFYQVLLTGAEEGGDGRTALLPQEYQTELRYRRRLAERYLRFHAIFETGRQVRFPGVARPGGPMRAITPRDLMVMATFYFGFLQTASSPAVAGTHVNEVSWTDSSGRQIAFESAQEASGLRSALELDAVNLQSERMQRYFESMVEITLWGGSHMPGFTIPQDVLAVTTGTNLHGQPLDTLHRILPMADLTVQLLPILGGILHVHQRGAALQAQRSMDSALVRELQDRNTLRARLLATNGNNVTMEMIQTDWMVNVFAILRMRGRSLITRPASFDSRGFPTAAKGIDWYSPSHGVVYEFKRVAVFEGFDHAGLRSCYTTIPGMSKRYTTQFTWEWTLDRAIAAHRRAAGSLLGQDSADALDLIRRFADGTLRRRLVVMSNDGKVYSTERALVELLEDGAAPSSELRQAARSYLNGRSTPSGASSLSGTSIPLPPSGSPVFLPGVSSIFLDDSDEDEEEEQEERQDRVVVVCIDRSGSMSQSFGGVSRLRAAVDGAAVAAETMRSATTAEAREFLGAVAFSGGTQRLHPISPPSPSFAQALLSLAPAGSTNISGGLTEAVTMIEEFAQIHPDRSIRASIILLTDGLDTTLQIGLLALFQPRGVRLNVVSLGPDADHQVLRPLAEQSGGRFLHAHSATMRQMIHQLFQEVRGAESVVHRQESRSQTSTAEQVFTIDRHMTRSSIVVTHEPGRPPAGVTLYDPSGQPAAGVQANRTGDSIVFNLESPTPGAWRAVLTQTGPYTFSQTAESADLRIGARTDQMEYPFPTPIRLQVDPTYLGRRVAGARVSARVTFPDGSEVSLPLHDDGNQGEHGDAASGDGVYSNFHRGYNRNGMYTFEITVENTNGAVVPAEAGANPFVGPFVRRIVLTRLVTGVPVGGGQAVLPPTQVRSFSAGGSVLLNWTDRTRSMAEYVVERRTGSDGPFREIARLSPGASPFVTDTHLDPTLSYSYRVVAIVAGRVLPGEETTLDVAPSLPAHTPAASRPYWGGSDCWLPTSSFGAPLARARHSAVWGGGEMLVYGGHTTGGVMSSTGARYDPILNLWTALPSFHRYREPHCAFWLGHEHFRMVVLGDSFEDNGPGGVYDPVLNSWQGMNRRNAHYYGGGSTAISTGSEIIAWGGRTGYGFTNRGARYNPNTNTWTPLPLARAPSPRGYHEAVWTGREMVIWGGSGMANTGALYRPGTNTWTPMATRGAPDGRTFALAFWTGSEFIVAGGRTPPDRTLPGNGKRYNPVRNVWGAPTTLTLAPVDSLMGKGVWTGNDYVFWGPTVRMRFNPFTGVRRDISDIGAPERRRDFTAVWTDQDELVVWGGILYQQSNVIERTYYLSSGGRYRP